MSLQMNEFRKSIEDMAAVSLRCVALAYGLCDLEDVPSDEHNDNWELPEDELILLGIVGIKVCMSNVVDNINYFADIIAIIFHQHVTKHRKPGTTQVKFKSIHVT